MMFRKAVIGAVAALSFVGCGYQVGDGPKISENKDTAFQTYQAITQQALKGVNGQGQSGLNGAVTMEAKLDSACLKGGKVTGISKGDLNSTGNGPTKVEASVNFDKCQFSFDNPETAKVEEELLTLNGHHTLVMETTQNGDSFNSKTQMKSDFEIDGAIDDFVSTNITVEMTGTKLTTKGTLKTSKHAHDFSAEISTDIKNGAGSNKQ
jgi:hypothetical protein